MYIFNSFYLLHSYNPSVCVLTWPLLGVKKKLGPRPDWSPLGVKNKALTPYY